MKTNSKYLHLVGVGMAVLLGGCFTPVKMADYTVTSFAEVPLADKAVVKVVAADDSLGPIAEAVKKNFASSGQFKVTEDKADYWFVLNGLQQYAKGVPQNKIDVGVQETTAGGQQVLVATPMNQASAARGVSVAVYAAQTLAPVTYLEIPVYSGDNTKEAVRGESTYDAAFAKEVVERINDAFVTSEKKVETPMPKVASGTLRDLFAAQNYKGFQAEYAKLGKVDLAKLCEALRTKTYVGDDADQKLGNYYLNLLVRETQTLDPVELKKIMGEQLMILEASENSGLAQAVPVALARLEYKLANLGE